MKGGNLFCDSKGGGDRIGSHPNGGKKAITKKGGLISKKGKSRVNWNVTREPGEKIPLLTSRGRGKAVCQENRKRFDSGEGAEGSRAILANRKAEELNHSFGKKSPYIVKEEGGGMEDLGVQGKRAVACRDESKE